MKRHLHAIAACLLLLSAPASAQTWTPIQREVWKAVEETFNTFLTATIDYDRDVHPDFIWWNTGSEIPGDIETAKILDSTYFLPWLGHVCSPLTIQAYDTFAVVNMACRGHQKGVSGQDPVWKYDRWNLTMKKEGTRWLLVACYGDFVSGNR